ncbi:filamentous hemagglutinin N-terminal domain-containing protein, partial [Pseudomonas aeruginosa]
MVRPDSQRGKRTSSKAGREGRFVLAASSTLMFAIASINAAMAAPTGAQFNPNEIKISQQGKTTLIDQSTQRAIINWKGFDVSADEAVRFNQPGVTSSTLNRVTAGQESVIAGRISAPGQVIIYNSNGVVFSGSAKVDVGSLITTTANISDEHFRQGKLIFDQPGNPDARIVNDGSISVAEKGLAAFVAPSVANNGVINARLGTVAMAAGNAATIDLYGDGLVSIAVTDPVTRKPQDAQALVSNGGAIQADGGSVLITAEQASRVVDNAVNLSGVILARGTEVREGSVALVSKSGDIQVAGKIDVSGLKNGDTAGAVLNGGSLSRVAGENVGVYGINQGGLGLVSANYDLNYQGNNLTITKALLNVIADAKTKVYGDADPSLTYQVSGLKNGDTAGAVLNGGGLVRVSGENVGNYAIQQGGLGLVSGNYDLAYQGNNLTITKALLNVIADAKTKVYGDADPSLTYQVSGLKNGDSAGSILTGGLNRAAGENVGVYGINQGDLALNSGNYDLSYQGNNLTITKALLNVIADAKTKVYGDADPALTYQVSGLKNGDTAGAVLNGGSLSRVAGENVGVYGINQGGLALNSGNYDLSYQGNNLTITKALLNVIADAKTKVYGDADPSLTYQVSGLKNGDSAGSILTGGLNRVAGENVGVYGINQGDLALNSGNYDLSYQGNNLTITKALLNVIADGKTKVYGDADPSLTYQVSGLKNGDTAGAVLNGGSLSRVAGENVGVYGINQGGLGLVSANY